MDTITSNSPESTLALGEQWATEARPGWVIGLNGDLGSGKTHLVKGIARGLGITEPITSPTFTLVCEYLGRLKLEHYDQIITSGLEPYLQPEGIAVIEWFNRWTGPRPADFRHVTFEQTGEHERLIRYEDFGA